MTSDAVLPGASRTHDGAMFADEMPFRLPTSSWRALPPFTAQFVVLPTFGGAGFVVAGFAQRDVSTAVSLVVMGLVALIPGLLVLTSMLRATRRPVLITRDGITIRNVVRTRTVTWEDVAGFELGSSPFGGVATILRLTTGVRRIPRSIPVTGLTISTQGASSRLTDASRALLQPVVDAMNAEIERRRGANPSVAERLATAHPAPRAIGWDDED